MHEKTVLLTNWKPGGSVSIVVLVRWDFKHRVLNLQTKTLFWQTVIEYCYENCSIINLAT